MSNICVFRKERNGRFINCSALKIGDCPAKCSFRKTENEYEQGILDAENRLKRMGLRVDIVEGVNGERYVTTKKVSFKSTLPKEEMF